MTIRDADRLKDKVEVSLDSRQIFFLFFGGSVIACLVFVLGVMVGKRLEGRDRVARRASTSALVDPLAALDELSADEQAQEASDLLFPEALGGSREGRTRPLGAAELAPEAKSEPPASTAPIAKAEPPAPASAPGSLGTPPAQPGVAAPRGGDIVDKADRPDKQSKAEKPGKKKGKYTLQLSSFQERADADAFAARVSANGYKPFIVMSDVPGRGVFYRVRVGEFVSQSDALTAKNDFERRQHMIAYVTRL